MINVGKKGYGFWSEDGQYYLIKCHYCDRENHHCMVALGECAWCGSKKTEGKKPKQKRKKNDLSDY